MANEGSRDAKLSAAQSSNHPAATLPTFVPEQLNRRFKSSLSLDQIAMETAKESSAVFREALAKYSEKRTT